MIDNTKDKKYILLINLFMQIVFCFFSVFFNIYVYEISNNFNIVILYTLTNLLFGWILNIAIFKFLNKKTLSIMYRLSFVLCFFCTMLTFFISIERLWLVFVIQMLYAITSVFYYIPSEVSTMSKNTKTQMKRFIGVNSALSVFSASLSPILSGYIIDYVSYYVLFSVMIVCIIVCFIFSTKLNLVNNTIEHIPLKDYINFIKNDKAIKFGYVGYAISKLSLEGPIEIILPILLFMRTGTNYSVGIYSSIASLLASIILLIYAYFGKRKSLVMWACTFFQIVISILILLSNSIVIFFIYYFIKKIVIKLLYNDINSSLFTLLNHTKLYKYRIEQHFVYHTCRVLTLTISCIICLIIYNFMKNTISLSLFLAITALFQILSTLFIIKSDKLLKDSTPLSREQRSRY